jgi:hypothetical protein
MFSGLMALAATAGMLAEIQRAQSANSAPCHFHARTYQIDPDVDATIRIPIPEQRWAGSKIRVIPPSCNNAGRMTSYQSESFRVGKRGTVPAARKR